MNLLWILEKLSKVLYLELGMEFMIFVCEKHIKKAFFITELIFLAAF